MATNHFLLSVGTPKPEGHMKPAYGLLHGRCLRLHGRWLWGTSRLGDRPANLVAHGHQRSQRLQQAPSSVPEAAGLVPRNPADM